MDHSENLSHRDHTIDIPRNDATPVSTSHQDIGNLDESQHRRVPLNEVPPVSESISGTTVSNSGDSSDARRVHGRREQNPVYSMLWILVELIVNVSQIIAAIYVLSVSRNEHPHAPLFEWLLAYTIGCIATLPHVYWRYLRRNHHSQEQEPTGQDPSERNVSDPDSNAASSFHASGFMDSANSTGVSASNSPIASPRVRALVFCYRLALACFFAVWFVVGNVWIFGSRSSVHDAPYLYRICIVFLAFGFIGYLIFFILCTMVCCCLPCMIWVGFYEDMDMNRGAATEAINSLMAYKFKSRKIRDGDVVHDGGGVLAAGTDKERTISAEDAVCCICLSSFSNNEDLRELPCAHVFHMECVDIWLQIKALCPLCKAEIGGSAGEPKTEPQNPEDTSRVRDDVESQR